MFRRLFRVYAHIYYHHHHELRQLGGAAVKSLDTAFIHFILHAMHFELVSRHEVQVMANNIERLCPAAWENSLEETISIFYFFLLLFVEKQFLVSQKCEF
eukprot:GABV01000730.1.p3 GENE.GABV01000730.1~~GABV01000730.1.p3  ORF type:complete len:100 (-),score=34.08 GABV01000730.1:253-552(-)